MKIRIGFVSNSSSSSFVCDICAETFNGYDGDYGDTKELCCIGGHSFCDEHLKDEDIKSYIKDRLKVSDLDKEEKDMLIEADKEDDLGILFDYCGCELPSELCPICNFKVLSDSDVVDYLNKTSGITRSEVFDSIKKDNKRRKKLHLSEYIEYACKKLKLTKNGIDNEIFSKFNNYEEFYKFLDK